MEVKLTDLIAPQFYDIHWDIIEGKHTHYKLYGGRGSTKSSFISIEIIMGMMQDPDANAACFRRVGNTLQESVYEQLLWAIDALGVSHLWKPSLSPLRITYLPTGQRIVFRGCDDPNKSKSIKLRRGYFKYIWYEERAEFEGDEDERKINQSLMRGGDHYVVFYSWNPPKSLNSWVNQDVLTVRDDTLCNHSTYLTVPREWLGEQFFIEANELKKRKIMAYRHEYLGEAIGTGGKVFDNVILREITPEEIAIFDKIRQGLDFGFAADPLAFLRMHYNKKQHRLYIYREIYQVNLKNREAVAKIKKINPENKIITADSEEPRSIATFNEMGLRLIGAKKGPGSVDFGMDYLSNEIDEIIIDPVTCPNAAREFSTYELERDKNGNFKGGYPDKDNHTIDACRYGLEDDMIQRKAKVRSKRAAGLR
ncbi:PBSX family phage terminase large subunit [Butyrivibrio sp. INlla14]|uniref:PBSX family phage terminase large subunit n=1 Tax=Butyrivibrio sp. INlla14 TaxID=1520808 RepID=UPI000876D154|nr:PBSX family phage terminase large subunit [Butyrivibrio sp. INlla14]SCY03689.1 phage terminase, large subunit, PBSX family [Butyrivibrio sp. INlla14]